MLTQLDTILVNFDGLGHVWSSLEKILFPLRMHVKNHRGSTVNET